MCLSRNLVIVEPYFQNGEILQQIQLWWTVDLWGDKMVQAFSSSLAVLHCPFDITSSVGVKTGGYETIKCVNHCVT